jgi:hypothetical protein
MFVVTEADAAAIRAVFEQRGEFPVAIELRRRFPGILAVARLPAGLPEHTTARARPAAEHYRRAASLARL